MALVEYVILIGFAIAGLAAVLGHHHGTFPISKGWLSLSGIGGKGSAVAGFLTAVFIFTGWVLPEFLGNVSRRFATPVAASVIVGVLIVGLSWVYLLTTSVQDSFNDVVAVTGLLFAIFYILTALATIVYYRRRVFTSGWDAVVLGVLSIAAAGFLGWIVVKSLQTASAAQIWSLAGVVAVGLVLMFAARFLLRSPFFQIQRESDTQAG
jgi:amino acid transporter